jgi:hypothetical protein
MITESELAELRSAILTGVTIGVGSQILTFGNGVSVLIQCPFKSEIKGCERWGHGEEVSTSVVIFDFLNHQVENVRLGDAGVLALDFGDLGALKIIPEPNGFESYVLTTKFGISPVLMI